MTDEKATPRVWWPVQAGQVYMEANRPAEHWILEFIGAFSTLQDTIRFAIVSRFQFHSPVLTSVLETKYLTRINDQDRWEYVKALGRDVGYEDNLNMASDAYWASKRLRDVVAHSDGLLLLREDGASNYHYQVPPGTKLGGLPDPLTPAAFRQAAANCRWLRAYVNHIASLGGAMFLAAGLEREDGTIYSPNIEMLAPPPLPVPLDWQVTDYDHQRIVDNGKNAWER